MILKKLSTLPVMDVTLHFFTPAYSQFTIPLAHGYLEIQNTFCDRWSVSIKLLTNKEQFWFKQVCLKASMIHQYKRTYAYLLACPEKPMGTRVVNRNGLRKGVDSNILSYIKLLSGMDAISDDGHGPMPSRHRRGIPMSLLSRQATWRGLLSQTSPRPTLPLPCLAFLNPRVRPTKISIPCTGQERAERISYAHILHLGTSTCNVTLSLIFNTPLKTMRGNGLE